MGRRGARYNPIMGLVEQRQARSMQATYTYAVSIATYLPSARRTLSFTLGMLANVPLLPLSEKLSEIASSFGS